MIETLPDALGHFGAYGGMFVPETLMTALHELAAEYERAKNDAQFQNQLARLLRDFAGRPTPLISRSDSRKNWAEQKFI